MKPLSWPALCLAVAAPAHALDCQRARTAPELAICGNPALKAYDDYLSAAYARVRAAAEPALFEEVRRSQIGWIRRRDAECGARVDCLIAFTQDRTARLNGFAQQLADRQRESEVPSAPPAVAAPLSAREVYKRSSPSVVVIHAFDAADRGVSQGSGVVLARDVVATNCHVVQGMQHVSVFYRGQRHEVLKVAGEVGWDYCLLETRGLPAPPVAMGTHVDVDTGQRVYTIGSPRGLELTMGEGIVSGLRRQDGMPLRLIQTTAPISPGSSGGGLFDEYGRVIGITTFMYRDSQNLNFAVPVELFRHLPKR